MQNINILNIKNIRYDLIYKMIKWQMSYNRINYAHVKEKSCIKKSTRKIYKQKGMGKARHGSLKANIFRGGGINFGPNKYKNYYNKVNKKIKIQSLKHAMALKYKSKSILIYKDINTKNYKCKEFKKIYGLFLYKKKTLIIDNNYNDNINLFHAVRNQRIINIINIQGINVLDIIKHEIICFSEKAFQELLNIINE